MSHILPLLLRWLIVDNLLLRGSAPWSICAPTSRWTSAATGLPVQLSIPTECCSNACFSSTPTGPSMCQSVSTLHATISRWWNSAPYGGVGRYPSFSRINISTRCGGSTQDDRFRLQWIRNKGSVREGCLPPITAKKLRVGKTVFRHIIH